MSTDVTPPPDTALPSARSPAVAPPPGNPRFPLFDSLRGIAVLAVLVFHVASITGAIGTAVAGDLLGVLGDLGLVLFFVISGFLLYRPFVAARALGRGAPRPARYARRRALRIIPAYWVALTVLAIYPGIVGPFSGDWWRYYLFAQLYSSRTIGAGIPVAWTLCVEVSFYIALPLWAAALRRVPAPRATWVRVELVALGLLAAGGVAVQVAASRLDISRLVGDSLAGQCTWFALGMALAVLSVASASWRRGGRVMRFLAGHSGVCWLGAAACLGALAAVLQPGGFAVLLALETKQPLAKTLGGVALTGALMLLLVTPAVFEQEAGGAARRIMRWAPLALLGLISYGVYLWHLTLIELLGQRTSPGQFSATGLDLVAKIHTAKTPILLVLGLLASCAIAALSYRFVELPFLRLKEPRDPSRRGG